MSLLALLLLNFLLWSAATLLPWSPGYALALNTRNNTEYAYSYPRRLSQAFTVEFWIRGNAQDQGELTPLSISHPSDDNLLSIRGDITLFNNWLMGGPQCPVNTWCHIAVSIDVTAYPTYRLGTYLNGAAYRNRTGVLAKGLPAAALEQESLAIVLGQEQDSQLGGFDPVQIFGGHMDEFRIWNTIRTPQEIQQAYSLSLAPPYPGSLVSYYTFDDSEWGPGYFQDRVNSSEQHRLYVADYASATTAAQPPPGYAPPANPLTRHAVSTAPVCSASTAAGGGALLMRAVPGGTLAVPVSTLMCGAAGPVTATVTSMSGGAMTANSQNAVGVTVNGSQTLLFTLSNASIVPGTGFNFTVSDASATVSGFVSVLPNSAPVVATSLSLTGDEDMAVSSWITVIDDDQDIVSVDLVVPPAVGAARLDGLINRTARYTPPANAFGANLGQYWVQAHDMWGAASATMLISVSLKPTPDAPQLLMNTSFSIYRGQRLVIPFDTVDVDAIGPFVIVSDWPDGAQGYLQGEDKGKVWTINDAMVSSNMQWASGFGNYSSMYGGSEKDVSYSISQIIGAPQCPQEYGDCPSAWSPRTLNAGCNNRASPAEAFFTFYSEYIEAKFASPMYLSAVILVENYGGDRVSRVLVPSDRNAAKWKTLMSRDVADSPASSALKKYTVESLPVCQTLWPVDRVRIEGDTCHRVGWWEVDAVQVRGGSVPPKNVLNDTAKLSFTATPGYTGTVTFGLTATTCYGSFDATSQPLRINVTVSDTPYVLTVVASGQGSIIDVGVLDACGPRSGNVLALELPTAGTLRYRGTALNTVLQDLGSPSTLFRYDPFQCDPQLSDAFIVQLGPTAVVQVNIRGCTTRTSQLVGLVALVALLPLFLAVVGFVWWRQARLQRDNSLAPQDGGRPIGVLFTDIQASTLLWGEVPELMARALDIHHDVIRRAIHKYRCYEVKTIGDSFMVVSTDIVALLQLAIAIQEALYDYDWGHEGFDAVYRRQTGCSLRADDYDRCWRGLRVRIGLHYGRAQITFDKTTKGFDYYGNVVNTAARIEGAAHGGQTLLSREAHEQVAALLPSLQIRTQPLGCVQLRGLHAPLDLTQILPARFADRVFPPLRIDHIGAGIGSPRDEEASTEDGRSSSCDKSVSPSQWERLYPQALDRDVLTHPLVRTGGISAEVAAFHAHSVFYSLRSQLNMFQVAEERRKRLRELCRQWHVPCRAVTDEQENSTLGRLALQLMGSVVTQMRSKQRANSLTSQGMNGSPPLSPIPAARPQPVAHPGLPADAGLSIVVLSSPNQKYVHNAQVVPISESP